MEPTGGRHLPEMDVHLERQMRSQERQLAVVRATIAGAALVAIVLFRDQLSSFEGLAGLASSSWSTPAASCCWSTASRRESSGSWPPRSTWSSSRWPSIIEPQALDAYLFYVPVMLGVALRYGLAASIWASVVMAFMYASVVFLATADGDPARELLPIRIGYLIGLGARGGPVCASGHRPRHRERRAAAAAGRRGARVAAQP